MVDLEPKFNTCKFGERNPVVFEPLLSFKPRSMLAHLILRLEAWPLQEVFEPQYTTEDAIEYHFGLVKSESFEIRDTGFGYYCQRDFSCPFGSQATAQTPSKGQINMFGYRVQII